MRGRGADLAALAVILLAGALSATWAFLVPIFQAPDEPAHFDYAISIMSAGRLIHVGDRPADWVVSPYTRYLLRATDFERIAWHSSMRVPPGYGSLAYFKRLDAGAPRLTRRIGGDSPVSYVAALYPFGFYALEAAWMAVVSRLTGSLTATFFGARLLCVFLLMTGLYFNYRTALNVGLSKWLATGFVAAIGLFPLTTFVSSYVQPDNLAYALVSASLFWASRLAKGSLIPRDVGLLGLSLGMLAVTKYQFFVAAALPIYALVALRLWKARAAAVRMAFSTAAMLLPTIALLAVQHWVVAPSAGGARGMLPTTVPTLASAAQLVAQGFVNCFVSGLCAATYWQVVGWFDTPIAIVNWNVEMALRILITLVSIGIVLIVAVRVVRNLTRLAAVAFRRGPAGAAAIATGDVTFNSYLCFLGIMLVLYVLTRDAFGAEGRHFYPYAFAGMLCAIWYAPRVLWKNHTRASGVAAAALVLYGLLSSGYALAAVHARYYSASDGKFVSDPLLASRDSMRQALGILRPVESSAYHVIGYNEPFTFPPDRWRDLRVSGIAAFKQPPMGAQSVAVMVDGDRSASVLTQQYEVGVAEGTRSRAYAYSGFYARLPTDLHEGPHVVGAYARIPDGAYEAVPGARMFFLTQGDDAFSRRFVGLLHRAPLLSGGIESLSLCWGQHSRTGELATVGAGGVVVVAGDLAASNRARTEAVWLMVGGRPYPARFSKGADFFGTIPTTGLSIGPHVIKAFAVGFHPLRYDRLNLTARFNVGGAARGAPFAAPLGTDVRCEDPLRLLEGTSP